MLDAQPDSDVVLTITSSDTGEATVTSSLTFTSANWDTAQVVTVTGVDDDLIDGTIASTVTVSVNDAASDNNFDAVADQTVTASTTDDDVAGFTIDQLDGSIEVDESGDTDTFTVVLDAQPTSDVVITITSSDTGEATVTSTLTFTLRTGTHRRSRPSPVWMMTSSMAHKLQPSLSQLMMQTQMMILMLLLTRPFPYQRLMMMLPDSRFLKLKDPQGLMNLETPTPSLLCLMLNQISDVVITVTSSDTGEATVTSSLTFTSANWDTAQVVTVTGVDDDLVDGTVNSTTHDHC
ncbi:MAG: hypothetical protein CM15mP49_29340 [Actinomycetota bacterium]|nr:MAG: hypothetical protein CM15mP49_29340 [Actinomycetota bacterium]